MIYKGVCHYPCVSEWKNVAEGRFVISRTNGYCSLNDLKDSVDLCQVFI
uniref:Uncharacterized protein n=1 Tax=Arundo donax TaxID=35708 RepID=A0A0A8Y7J1_ARUDO